MTLRPLRPYVPRPVAEKKDPSILPVAKNRKALFEYEVLESVEAGMMLSGTEAKSLRDGKLQLGDAYCLIEGGEMFLVNAHISEYDKGNIFNHDTRRKRKLLLHRSEIDRWSDKVEQKGNTLIALEVYFRNGWAKVKVGLCRGKQAHDKRASIRDKDMERASRRGED